MEENEGNSNTSQDNDEIINDLVKQGKYDEVMKYLNDKEKKESNEINISNDNIENIELELSSLKDDENKNKSLSQSSVIFNPYDNGFEMLLEDNQLNLDNKPNLIITNTIEENENKKNIEMFERELKDLDNIKDYNTNNIEQLNEMYQMIQEDKLSNIIQIKTREKLFPYYNQAILSVNREIENDLFVNLPKIRNSYISFPLINYNNIAYEDINIIENKYKAEKTKSVYEDIVILQKDKKKVDYNELMLLYEKDNTSFDRYISESYSNFFKRKETKQKKKGIIIININSTNATGDANYNNRYFLQSKIKSWMNNSNVNSNSNINKNDKRKYNIKEFNRLFLNCFNTKKFPLNEANNNSILELIINNQNLKEIPSDILKSCKNLKTLNLEENQINKISNLKYCPYLYSLNLNKNKIQKIENISHLTLLEKLTLNFNCIEQIENCAYNQRLKSLSIWKNKIHSINSIETELLYIEELILSENNITFLPEKFSLPYLKYLDLNGNKIKNINNFFYCPSLEKLLLQNNNINGDRIEPIFQYCERLREIDLSFNKIQYASFTFGILQMNKNIESIDVRRNPFYMSNGKICIKMFKKIFPKLKAINNESIPKEKNKIKYTKRKLYTIISANYFDIFQLKKLFFMRYYSSIVFTNKVLNVFNLNITSDLTIDKVALAEIVNYDYFIFKKNHLNFIGSFLGRGFADFAKCSKFSNELIRYLYDFKYKMIYLKSSMGIFAKNFTLRLLKIQRIQETWKVFYIRKQLKAIKFVDEDKGNYDELLDFFGNGINAYNDNYNNEPNFNWEEEKIKEIERNLMNIGNSIREEKEKKAKEGEGNEKQNVKEKNKNNTSNNTNIPTINSNNSNININSNSSNIFSINLDINNNNTIINSYSNIPSIQKPNFHLEPIKSNDNDNEFDNQSYLKKSINSLSKARLLSPLNHHQNIQLKLNKLPNNSEQQPQIDNNLYYNLMKKNDRENESISNVSTPNALNELNVQKLKYYPKITNKFNRGDNIPRKMININNQMIIPQLKKNTKINAPIKQESNVKLPSIKTNVDSNSVTNEDTRSLHSGMPSASSKFTTYKGKPLPAKAIEQIRRIEEECKIAIRNAKEEWNGLDEQTILLISKKISKKYKKQINKIVDNL